MREPADGQFVVEVDYLSLDPAMRGWMNEGRSYVPPVGIGEVMRAGGIGRVRRVPRIPTTASASSCPALFGVQRYALSDGRRSEPRWTRRSRPHRLVARGAGNDRADRVLRAARHRAARARADRGRVRRGRRGRERRRADRADQGLPGRRDRRRSGEVRVAHRGARLRRRDRLQARRPARPAPRARPPTASMCTSTTSAGRSSTRCCAASRAAPGS